MRVRVSSIDTIQLRHIVVSLTLFAHLMSTFGFPIWVPIVGPRKSRSIPFPCQNRPCGCQSAEQCWSGDCCCFTMEEKLAWARERGIEPPPRVHARPQKAATVSAGSKTNPSCCCEPSPDVNCRAKQCDEEFQRVSCSSCGTNSSSSCRETTNSPRVLASETRHSQSQESCCSTKQDRRRTCSCDLTSKDDSAEDKSDARITTDSDPARDDDRPRIRWVLGIMAKKCCHHGPSALILTPTMMTARVVPHIIHPRTLVGWIALHSDRASSLHHTPPEPPPKAALVFLTR